jgi:hypothetical protein
LQEALLLASRVIGVDPVWWTPEHLRTRSPPCGIRDEVIRQSFVAK